MYVGASAKWACAIETKPINGTSRVESVSAVEHMALMGVDGFKTYGTCFIALGYHVMRKFCVVYFRIIVTKNVVA